MTESNEGSKTYAGAGVDIDKADRIVGSIKGMLKTTEVPGVMGEIGGFGGLFSLIMANYEKPPILVSSTDGVGTKLKIAFMTGKHDTVGIDLVGMCVNDVAVQGAKPLFFLDYFSAGKLEEGVVPAVISGMVKACREAECAIIGGETAEMPGFYPDGHYDLAGFSVGAVDADDAKWYKLFNEHRLVEPGNKILGIPSNGVHSNGFSLARDICFVDLGLNVDDHVDELGCTLGEELLRPTRIYVKTCQALLNNTGVTGLAHITGGGMLDNIPRVLPKGLGAKIKLGTWPVDPIFRFLEKKGPVKLPEMLRTFNYGIGLVAIVREKDMERALPALARVNETVFEIGEIVPSSELADGKQIQFIE